MTTDRRAILLDRLADHVLQHGLLASSLRPLARAGGISDRMLLYHFVDKEAVMAATLDRVAARLAALLDAHVVAVPLPLAALERQMLGMVSAPALWPYMRLWLEIASRAAGGDALYRDIGARIGRGFVAWCAGQLDSPTPARRQAEAARLLVTIEGAVLLRAVGLHDVVALLD